MTQSTNPFLVVTPQAMLTIEQHAALIERIEAFAKKIGAEALVLPNGAAADVYCSGPAEVSFQSLGESRERWHASIKDGLAEALEPGRAKLQDMMLRIEATTAQLREELKGEPVKEDPVLKRNSDGKAITLTAAAQEAVNLVGRLIDSGDVVLTPDKYHPGRSTLLPSGRVSASEPVTAVQGDAIIGGACADLVAVDSASHELESAIASTVGLLDDNVTKHPQCCEVAGEMLVRHLEGLLAAQLARVTTADSVQS